MKLSILLISLVFSIISYSQKIVVNEMDKFTKQRRVETNSVTFKAGLSESIGMKLRSVDTAYFITLSGYGSAADVIGANDKAIFLLDNDSTITVTSTGIQSYNLQQTSIGTQKLFNHQYHITLGDLRIGSLHMLKSIRKYGAGGYVDIDIPKRNEDNLSKTCQVFLGALKEI